MKLFRTLALAGSLLFLLPGMSHAEDVKGLYEAEVPIESQDRQERDVAIQRAFEQVLVRVSGRHLVLTISGVEQMLEQANQYVQQFRYRSLAAPAQGQPAQVLWVRFDKAAVDNLLHDNRMPVWGSSRPSTLVWLAVDDRDKRQLISNDMDTALRRQLDQAARLRGLPLRLPLMDLTDRNAVRVSDVWGNFADNLLQASQRYQPAAVLVGRVFRAPNGTWDGRWSLYMDGQRQDWSSAGMNLAEVLDPGVHQVADVLAERFARLDEAGGTELLLVRIRDVRDLRGYTRLMDYLAGLSQVSRVEVQRIQGDEVIVRLTTRTGQAAISRAIGLGHTLYAEPLSGELTAAAAPQTQAALQYRLLP